METGASLALLALVGGSIAFTGADVVGWVGPTLLLVAYGAMLWVVLRLGSHTGAGRPGRALTAGLGLVAAAQAISLLSRAAESPGLAALASGFEVAGALAMAMGLGAWVRTVASCAKTSEQQVAELEERLNTQNERLTEALTTDELTGVLNQRTFLERLNETVQRDARLRKPFSFLFIQPVGLRAHGRQAADAGLREVARILQSVSRGTDFVGRVGDGEFAVALGECEDPLPAARRIVYSLSDGRRKEKPPLRVRIGAVTAEATGFPADVNELFRLGEDAARSLGDVQESRWAQREVRVANPVEELTSSTR